MVEYRLKKDDPMIIRRFNESQEKDNKDATVYCVSYVNRHSFSDDENHIKIFTTRMMASDYLIKLINSEYETNYEPFYSSDNDRYFSSIDENMDFEKCLEFCSEKEIDIEIYDLKLNTTPYNDPRVIY